jgi:hypothetical protein
VSFERVFEVLDLPSLVAEPECLSPIREGEGDIENFPGELQLFKFSVVGSNGPCGT